MREAPAPGSVPRLEVPGWRAAHGLVAGLTVPGPEGAPDGFDLGLRTERPVRGVMERWDAFRSAEPGFGAWVLGVPFRGDVVSYLAVSVFGALVFAGMGILVASRVRTIEGVSGLMNVVMLPMWLASGVFFSYERFPEFTHVALRLLPLTALNDALRAIMLDGESLLNQGPELAVLAGWGIFSFAIALRIFRWE